MFAVTVPLPLTVIGVPDEPMSPEPPVKLIVLDAVSVKAPERVMVPDPLAERFSVVVVEAPTLAPMLMLPLLDVARVTVPDEDCDTVLLIVSPVPLVIEIAPVVAVTPPVIAFPKTPTVKLLVPRVCVNPLFV